MQTESHASYAGPANDWGLFASHIAHDQDAAALSNTGLLEPAESKSYTGYRRYLTNPIPQAQMIKRFRQLRMPLNEIRQLLASMVTFARSFTLKGVDRVLSAGDYRVVTDEELIEELSFPVYRRVSTMIFVPAGCLIG